MDFLIILIDLVVIALGIVDVRFGFKIGRAHV